MTVVQTENQELEKRNDTESSREPVRGKVLMDERREGGQSAALTGLLGPP